MDKVTAISIVMFVLLAIVGFNIGNRLRKKSAKKIESPPKNRRERRRATQ